MASKHINYINRDFDTVKGDLIKFSKENYPQLSDNFGNDASVSSWFIDVLAESVDSLNYHIDRTFQNTQLGSTTSKSALLNIARSNGLKIPGPKAGMASVDISCVLPAGYTVNGRTDISQPNWNAAPVIQRGCVVAAGNHAYTINENVDFGEQYNDNAYSNRTYLPRRNANGVVTGYTVTKTNIIATSSTRRIYKKKLSADDIQPFMEVMLPDVNVMNVESIIFKSVVNLATTPDNAEFYIDNEEYYYQDSPIITYRFFETNSLTDQWRWGSKVKNNAEIYSDFKETSGQTVVRETRVYAGEWKPLRQKFITEYTDNGYMKVIFGSGVDYANYPEDGDAYTKYRMSTILNNDMLGVLPKEGWTMYILYNVGGGIETNVAAGAINSIKSIRTDFPRAGADQSVTKAIQATVLKSLKVNNPISAVNGKDAPSINELKYLVKYNSGAQERCVTVKDYQARISQMPPKYGSPFRVSAYEENNKVVLGVLGITSDGKLTKAISNTMAKNMEEYLKQYRSINDYVEIRSGKIYHIGFMIDAFIDKSYNAADVINSIRLAVIDYMDISNSEMGQDIFIGDLEKEITTLDGVISLIKLQIYKVSGGLYSSDVCPLPIMENVSLTCSDSTDEPFMLDGANTEAIDLEATDHVLLGDNNAMYEIYNPSSDIQIRVKQR